MMGYGIVYSDSYMGLCGVNLVPGCRNVVRVLGLGFKPDTDGHDDKPESMFICQELCQGGSLRSLVLNQMCKPHTVGIGPPPSQRICGDQES